MKKALFAAALVAMADLLQHDPALAQLRWCPRC